MYQVSNQAALTKIWGVNAWRFEEGLNAGVIHKMLKALITYVKPGLSKSGLVVCWVPTSVIHAVFSTFGLDFS